MIYTTAEAKYIAAFNAYEAARKGFYAGTVSAENFVALRKDMEAALDAFERETLAA